MLLRSFYFPKCSKVSYPIPICSFPFRFVQIDLLLKPSHFLPQRVSCGLSCSLVAFHLLPFFPIGFNFLVSDFHHLPALCEQLLQILQKVNTKIGIAIILKVETALEG